MKNSGRIFLTAILLTLSASVFAQNADALVKQLVNKYGAIPNYKVNVTYVADNADMGFTNTQEGVLVVEGNRYKMSFGPNETWLCDGTAEIVGTKEEDHSQIMYFCPGKNSEEIVSFGNMLAFYGTGHTASMEEGMLKLTPYGNKPYIALYIQLDGENIKMIKALDELGTAHMYTISGLSTSVPSTQYTINKNEYAEKIDERKGCN
ncbi:MAG: hypothetical protein ACI9QN_001212 [Arcticibacterium sp.]|jgi:hypothetical protein